MNFNPIAIPTLICSAAFFWLGSILERRTVSGAMRRYLFLVGLTLAIPGSLFVLYYTHLFDSAAWFYNFRALSFSELTACGLGLIAGSLHSWFQPERLGEKVIAPTALLILVFVPFMKPILVPLDLGRLQDRCEGEVCMQSTLSTCGPSSAATILKAFGQSASEKQLATECFTYRGGTEIWYLARAFRRRGFDVHVVTRSLDSIPLSTPTIAGVVLPGGGGHFIAVLNDTPDQMTIGDPLKGKLVIKKPELETHYHFTGLFLVVRSKQSSTGKT